MKKLLSIALSTQLLLGLISAPAMADGVVSLDDISLLTNYSDNFELPTKTTSGDKITWSSSNTNAVIPSGDTAYVLRGLASQKTTLTATLNGTQKTFEVSVSPFEYQSTPLFAENFEGYDGGESLNTGIWRLDDAIMPNTSDQSGANYMGIASVDGGNHVYMIKRTDNSVDGAKKSYIHINTADLPANSRIIYEADVCAAEQPKNASGGAIFMNYWLCRDIASNVGKYSGFATGYIGGAKGISIKGTLGSYSTTVASAVGKWHNIKFDVTSVDGLFDSYVDGIQVGDDYEMRAKGAPLKHFAIGFDGNTTGEVLLDNIKYYVCPNDADTVLGSATIGVEDSTNVIGNVDVPNVKGITWVSSNPSVVSSNGIVDRSAVNGLSETVTLFGIYSEAGMTTAKAFPLTVLGNSAEEMDEKKALDALMIPSVLTDTMTLPANYGDIQYFWSSSNENAVLPTDGKAIVIQSNLPSKAILTASVNTADGALTKSFEISVPAVGSEDAYVDEDFDYTTLGELPYGTIASGDMWRRRNETDTFGVSEETPGSENQVLRLKAAECVLLNFDGFVENPRKIHYLTYSTKTEGNPIANIRFLDVQDNNPASGHQIVNLLEGNYRGVNQFLLQAANNASYPIADNTWYDVCLKVDYTNSLVTFYVKKSEDSVYTQVATETLKYKAVPKKAAIWFDSGEGAHVYDNFKFYSSDLNTVPIESALDASLEGVLTKTDSSYIATSDFTFPSPTGYTTNWYSEDEDVITNDGTLTKPQAGSPNAKAAVRAVVFDADDKAVFTKVYSIEVTPMLNDVEAVSADAAALTLGKIQAVTNIKEMVANGANGTTISWTSSDLSIVAPNGTVTRPMSDTVVDITATISRGSASQTKTFTVIIPKATPADEVVNYTDAVATVRKGVDTPDFNRRVIVDKINNTTNDRHGYMVFSVDVDTFNGDSATYKLRLTRAADGDENAKVEIHAIPNDMICEIDKTLTYDETFERGTEAGTLYEIEDLIAYPTLARSATTYVDITNYVKQQLEDEYVPEVNGKKQIAIKIRNCDSTPIVIEGANNANLDLRAAIVVERDYSNATTFVRTVGNTAKLDIFKNTIIGAKNLIAASYDEFGRLVDVAIKTVETEELGTESHHEVSVENAGAIVHAFLWDTNMKPLK